MLRGEAGHKKCSPDELSRPGCEPPWVSRDSSRLRACRCWRFRISIDRGELA